MVKSIESRRNSQSIAFGVLNSQRLWYQLAQNHVKQSDKAERHTKAK